MEFSSLLGSYIHVVYENNTTFERLHKSFIKPFALFTLRCSATSSDIAVSKQ